MDDHVAAPADEAPYHPTPAAAAAGWRLASVDAGPPLVLRYVRAGRHDELIDAAGGPYTEALYAETSGGTRVRLDGGGRHYEAWTDARLPRAGDPRPDDAPQFWRSERVAESAIVFSWRGGYLDRPPAAGPAETRSGPRGTVRRWRWGGHEYHPEWLPRRPPPIAAAAAALLLGRRSCGMLGATYVLRRGANSLTAESIAINFLMATDGRIVLRYAN